MAWRAFQPVLRCVSGPFTGGKPPPRETATSSMVAVERAVRVLSSTSLFRVIRICVLPAPPPCWPGERWKAPSRPGGNSVLSLRPPELPPTAEEEPETLAEHVLCARCRTRRLVSVASFDPHNGSVLQMRRKEVAESGFKSPAVWLESMCPSTAGGFALSGPLSLSSVGKRQMQEHSGRDVLRGFSDPDWSLSW